MSAKICLVLTADNLRQSKKDIQTYLNNIDLIELRLDLLKDYSPEEIVSFSRECPKPLILTYRKTEDGGLYGGSEKTRLNRMAELLREGSWAYVDLEENLDWPQGEKLAKETGVKIIRSFHDFNGVSPNWWKRFNRLEGDICKAALMPGNYRELSAFYEGVKHIKKKDRILIAMGELGFSSRILASRLKSFCTFSSPQGGVGAPGHIDPKVLDEVYNIRSLNGEEKIFGIIGQPVMHTQSPKIHNPAFKKSGFPGVYIPFPVDELKEFFSFAELMDIKGLSVTIPHKENVIRELLKDRAPEALQAIGACNTLKRTSSQWEGINTDAPGFLQPLEEQTGSVQGKRVAVIGAGGAARAVVYALVKGGAKVCVFNRTVEKAKNLAHEFSVDYGALEAGYAKKISEYGDIIVQTTSVGMHPMEDRDPIGDYSFTGKEIVYDIIYIPEKTLLLQRAEKAGCRVLNGFPMLKTQGELQFEYFTGQSFPR